jgi:hypothetical protein
MLTLTAVIAFYFQTGDALDIRKLAEKYRRTLVDQFSFELFVI